VAFENDLARIVSFGEDADQFASREYEQGAYRFVRHFLDGFVYGLLGSYGQDSIPRLALENSFDGVSQFHRMPPRRVRVD
jgi:hypothetical protein